MFQTGEYGWNPADAGDGSSGAALIKSWFMSERIHFERTADHAGLSYHWFKSSQPRPDLPLFFAVHGIKRQAKDQAKRFAPYIEAIGGTLIAPVFGKRQFDFLLLSMQLLDRTGLPNTCNACSATAASATSTIRIN